MTDKFDKSKAEQRAGKGTAPAGCNYSRTVPIGEIGFMDHPIVMTRDEFRELKAKIWREAWAEAHR